MRARALLVPVIGWIALHGGAAQAQTAGAVGGGGLFVETYRFADPDAAGVESLTLFTVPVAFRGPLGRVVSVEMAGAYARGTLTRPDGSEAALSGLTDTQVTLSATVVPDRVVLSAIGVLPTGRQKHTDGEAEVAGAISADLLPFRVSNWSTGGGIGLASAIAHSTGAVGMGVSAAYVVGREFDLLDAEDFAYRPGDQLSVRAVVDFAVGTAGKLSTQVAFQRASEDRVNGSNLYRPGSRVHVMASYTFRAGTGGSGILYSGLLHRAAGAYLLESARDAPSEDLLLAGGGVRLPLRGTRLLLQPSVDLRIVRRADGTGQGYLVGAGAALEWRRPTVTVLPSVRARFGKGLVREDVQSGFTGLDLGFIVRFGRPR